MATETTIDRAKAEAFVGKVLGDSGGAMATLLAGIGDRLGLFKNLAADGSATSEELAARAGLNERYVREWLGGMLAAGYLAYDPATERFTLPPEHVPVLATEGDPVFFGGLHQDLLAQTRVLDQVSRAFREGGGVPQSAYGEDNWDGLERVTSGWFENSLLDVWLPGVPEALARLERGCDVADVGCGRGRALIKLATAFPNSRFVGFDNFEPGVERATIYAHEAGVSDRVRFEQRDAARGLPARFDLVTTFDVIHDSADPPGILRAIRQALSDDGVYLCVDINASDKREENVGPIATLFYGFSILYCMTTSLAAGGMGLGTVGLPESVLRLLATQAGFGSVRRVPLDNPFNSLFEFRP
jgi:2-polyprenyl-3-methyl-5-hydroxy-6-metoxy-1,4-benzoquinol methylase